MQVVGVLPDIQCQDRRVAGQADRCAHQRAVLVGAAFNLQVTVAISGQPRPAAAEAGLRGLAEGILERIEAAEIAIDGRAEFVIRGAATGAEYGPEQAVVGVATAIVAHRAALRFGHRIKVGDERLDRLRGDAGLLEGGIEVVDVGLVVLAVVDLHRARIEVRLEGIIGVGERGKRVRHRSNLRGEGQRAGRGEIVIAPQHWLRSSAA
ncbi:hypothetical protein G6F22_018417 [Rhizopus arrhizus]|nr:hypothetical protein G6F22_018417 [Rhizopus arrhizus]